VRAALIVNPFASRVDEERLRAVEAIVRPAATLYTERHGHGVELARAAEAEFDALVVFSGDGVFNEVLNGIEGRVPLGFVPGGGTSVLPRALGLGRDPVEAARRVTRGRVRRISLGRVNGRRFSFGAGVGLDAELVRRVDALGRDEHGRRPGDLAFARVAAVLVWERRARFDDVLEVRGHGRAAFALASNGDPFTYAGRLALHVAPRARFELGLDLTAPRRVRPSTLPRLVPYVVAGRGDPGALGLLALHDADLIEIVCDAPLPLQADGEDLGDVTDVVFEAERDAVEVLY
jgi:diacylglycerol kinase family enzyme